MSNNRPLVGVGVVIRKQTPDGPRVLLIQRGAPPRQGQWSIPGGKQELGETVRDAARREVREETGLDVADLGLVDVFDMIDRSGDGTVVLHYTLVDFAADWISGEPIAGSDAMDVAWADPADLDAFQLSTPATRTLIALAFEGWPK